MTPTGDIAGPRAKARSSAPGSFYLAASFGQKGAHLAKDFILSVDEAVVVRIRKHHDSAVRNRFTKDLDLLFFELASFLKTIVYRLTPLFTEVFKLCYGI